MPRFFDDPADVDSGELFSLTFDDVKSNASSNHIPSPQSAHSPAASEVSSASRLASLVRSPASPKFKSARSSTRSSLGRLSNGAGEKAQGTAPAKAGKEMTPASSSSGARQSTRVRSAAAQAKPAAAAATTTTKTTRKASASAKRELRTKGRTDAKGAIRKPGRPARAAAVKPATTKTAASKTEAVKPAAAKRRGRPPKEASKAAKPAKAAAAAAAGGKATKQEWEVEQIVDSMIDEETMEHFFKVKWKGYSSKDNTWEPKKNLANCKDLLEAYEKKAKK
ncbi:hypothetical protein V8C44DRAFT_335767 [Trichoderma aethiopicum]